MVTLDNLVVTTAIPVIRKDLHASLSGLQWTVNAYTLTFAVLLLTGAALGLKRELWHAVPRAGFWPATPAITRAHWRRMLPGMFRPPIPGRSSAASSG